jgi:hypothetical protein
VCEDVIWAPLVCKADPGEIVDIVQTMSRVWFLRKIGLGWWTRLRLRRSNRIALQAWLRDLCL